MMKRDFIFPQDPADVRDVVNDFQNSDHITQFIEADVVLGFAEQNFCESRDALIKYAVQENLQWALPTFLRRRGWLDADWSDRLNDLGERLERRVN